MSKKKKYTYQGLKVQQTPDCVPFYLTAVDAAELLKWCDVPRKKAEFMAGYQRMLHDRHEKIKTFIELDPKNNIIPNAILVAARDEHVRVTPAGESDTLVNIEIEWDELNLNEAVTKVLSEFQARLSDEEKASIEDKDDEEDDTSEENEDEASDEATPPTSYLASLTANLREAEVDFAGLSPERQNAVKEYVLGVSRPGLILDGQHRVFGAKNVASFDVCLPVILLPGLTYSEQVFHFYVLNNKAKPLTKTELRGIVSTSLGKREIEKLYERFKQTGVATEQTQFTYRINTDPDSPFLALVDMGLGGPGVVPENVAYQVVSKFVNLPAKYRLLYKDISDWGKGSGMQTDYAFRFELFYALWKGVSKKYPAAWEKAVQGTGLRQILQKVALLNLQEHILTTFVSEMPRRIAKGEKSPFADPRQLEEDVAFVLEYLPEEFFLKEWRMKGLDTTRGHQTFRETINKAIQNQGQNLGNMKLFRE